MSLRSPRRLPVATLSVALSAALLLGAGPALQAQVSQDSMPLDSGFGPLDPTPPSLPVAQIIKEFTTKETIFSEALNDYTWTRTVRVRVLDDNGQPTQGQQYYQVVDIYYNPQGQRKERVVDAPESTIQDVIMTESDFSDIEERLFFVLTDQAASQYDITYLGKQRIDQIQTWVFAVKPKVIVKGHRYFQGRIWVDQREHQIVVTDGKNVPDDLRPGHQDLTLPFITWRQLVDNQYWFPVYTHGRAVLNFSAGKGYLSQSVNMDEMVTYTNYHRFRTSIRVIYNGKDITNQPQKQPPAGSAPPAQPQPPQ
ncbi:MAG TPA: hypothetical protein VME18_11540 [Acidobacteriaceae bacterium]|nr:hypothetical protein [Acidobacteriaceae bacterium]